MFKSILVPIDLADPERGKASIAVARSVAGSDAKIRLVSILEDVPSFVAAEIPKGVSQTIRETAEADLKAIATAAGLKAGDAEVHTGSAASGILETAENIGADLIIVGSHKPALQDYLIGSTAGRVVRHAKCAVLVTR
ncbi:MAG: universal stress protein [Pseudomonadota bacterium]